MATIISCPSGISDAYRTGIPNLSGQLFGASFNPSEVNALKGRDKICADGRGFALDVFLDRSRHDVLTATEGYVYGNYNSKFNVTVSVDFPSGQVSYQYGNCSNAGCGGWFGGSGALKLVATASTDFRDEFWFLSQDAGGTGNVTIPQSSWTWKPVSAQNMVPVPGLTLDRLRAMLAIKVQEGLREIETRLPQVPQEPVRSTASYSPGPKGEFETTEAYQSRTEIERKNFEQSAAQSYKDAVDRWQKERRNFDAATAAAAEARDNPLTLKVLLKEIADTTLPAALGSPSLTGIAYDADRQEFSAQLSDTSGLLKNTLVAGVPLKDAPRVKADLLSGKTAPVVEISLPDFNMQWALKENAALRAQRFANANNSIANLETFLEDYPDAPESKQARGQVLSLAKTSKELHSLMLKHGDWPESRSVSGRLSTLQLDEFAQAKSDNSSYAYSKFIENFGGPDPKKLVEQAQKARVTAKAREDQQARDAQAQWERDRPRREAASLCQAQVNTCIASCPRQWSDISKSYIDIPDYSCKSRCESVSCN